MKSTHLKIVVGAVAVMALTIVNASVQAQEKTPGFNQKIPEKIMTPDTVETRIGALKFVDGVPTPETAQKVYDNLDFLRGTEVFLNFVPATNLEGMRLGNANRGATKTNQAVIMDQLADSNPLWLTANTDTVYLSGFLDLNADGPTVVEIPPGTGPGTLNDAFFRFVTDMGAFGPHQPQGNASQGQEGRR